MRSATNWMRDRIASYGERAAIAYSGGVTSYGALALAIDRRRRIIEEQGIGPGAVVAHAGDFHPDRIALHFALALSGAIVVPLGTVPQAEINLRIVLGQIGWISDDHGVISPAPGGRGHPGHPLLAAQTESGEPGLILFSSGTSGPPKAALHDLDSLYEKFQTERPAMRTAGFLLFDHIGGLNTMWHVLANGGLFACLPDRSGEAVATSIAKHRLELLPTSPTFVNLFLLSGALERHDVSSLRVITYGTEPMPASTLARIHAALPGVEMRQTYGLSELGILRAKSESSDSLWVKLGGEGFETRVDNGILKIRARSAMHGYLNAPAPFDADGWFNTGDQVEVQGDYLRILGRVSEVVNVGGQKVHPSEVESVILELDTVAEVAVSGEPNPLLGHVLVAQVMPAREVDPATLRAQVRSHCRQRLAPHKVPAKVVVVSQPLHSQRFKKKIEPAR